MDSASAVVEMKNAAPEAQQKVIGQQTQRSAFTRHHESLGVTRSHPELLRMTHVHGGTQQDCIFAMVTEWKTCVVCDDRPSGYHYGVMACEGCKAFFRRSISRSEAYKCIRKRLYAITKESRNRCQACRLNKCIAQGMSKAMLKGPTGKHERAAPTGCSDEARCGRVSDQRSYLSEAKENGVVVNG